MSMFKLGLCQMQVTGDKAANLRRAETLLRQAADRGANLAVLPEMFNCPYENACFPLYGEPAGGETWQFLSGIAKELGIYLVGGSVPELEDGKIYNTSYIFSPEGKELGRHRKVHLFDIDVPGGQRFMESDTLTAGDSFTLVDTPLGKLGVAICFDIRFSDFFRVMGDLGAQLIVIPAAFNMTTGPLHWDLAFRMRALDNQCFVAGCSPARDVNASYVAYGHSLVCDPWGTIVAQLDEKEGVIVTDIDLNDLDKYRGQIPILAGRRTDLYRTERLR
ncbi:MAG: carbon-nitrogen hydrolase family protein [Clostridiales bacterium]|nr:carbon-nitrogen hydrolase family protein [Clostridiales bacterium]